MLTLSFSNTLLKIRTDMKTLVLSFAIMLSFSANAFAQNRLFRMHRSHCSKQHSIDLIKLKDFKVIAGLTIFRINEKMNIGMFYQMVLESKSKDCLILYPCFDTYSSHYRAAKNMPYREVKAALNMDSGSDMRIKVADGKFMVQGAPDSGSNEETAKLDTAQYIRIIAEDNMKDYFNADTVFIFKVRLPSLIKNRTMNV